MALIHAVIEKLLGDSITEQHIKDAFTLEHPDFTSHAMVEEQTGGILVHGDFHTSSVQCAFAGCFERYIYLSGGHVVAHHRNIFIQKPYRKQKIARAHLSKVVRFYDAVGIEYVHLQAVDYGPVVWPQLGFEIQDPSINELLQQAFRTLCRSLGYEVEPPARTARLATAPALEGVAVGLEALRATYASRGFQPIPMVLDLKDKVTREYLAARGIL